MRLRPLLLLLTIFCGVLVYGPAAHAHTALREAKPESDAQLTEPPVRVELRFSGKVEVQHGAVTVVDATGTRVDQGDAAVDPAGQREVTASLKPLTAGGYTVVWRVMSADGHTISGTYRFWVLGDQAPAAPVAEPPAGQVHAHGEPGVSTPTGPSPGSMAAYGLGVAGLLALAGLTLVQGLVVRESGGPGLRRWLWGAWGAALAGALALLLFRTAEARGVSLAEVLLHPGMLWGLGETSAGKVLFLRLGVLALTPAVLLPVIRRWWATSAAASAGLLTVAMGGHAAALEPVVLAVGMDWLHLLSAAAWTGGLLQFAFLIRTELSARLGRFSGVAAVSVAVLTGTGLYPALAHVPSAGALLTTLYGRALVIKLLLVVALMLLGAANLLVVGPGLRRGEALEGSLRGLLAGEVALIAGVLAVTAVLTNVEPARLAVAPPELSVGMHTRDYELIWAMSPVEIGFQPLLITVHPHDGEIGPDATLRVQPVHVGHDMKIPPILGVYEGEGRFRFDRVPLTMTGMWEFHLTIERPGFPPGQASVDVEVPPAP